MSVVSENVYELHGEPAELDRLADAARSGEVTYLTRDGERVAAVVPADAAGVPEQAEEAHLPRPADEAEAEIEAGEPAVPWDELKAELGL
jgi:antitoxin Phd